MGLLMAMAIGCKPQWELVMDTSNRQQANATFDWSQYSLIDAPPTRYREDRIIKVQVHFINTIDTLLDLSPSYALQYARVLIDAANSRLQNNDKMHLPVGNATPVLDTHLRLRLEDQHVYIHYDKEPYFRKSQASSNQYDRAILKKYETSSSQYVNIFIMPFDPEEVAAGIQKIESAGIALGGSIKLAGLLETKAPAWNFGGLLVHEIGHILTLRHTWNTNDACEDTPRHANCWSNTGMEPCDQIESNNVMDYNPHQSAFTPCQISRMHAAIATKGTLQSRIVEQDWCHKREPALIITEEERWATPVLNSHDIIIQQGGRLILSSWLSMPNEGSITIEKGGMLLLDGATIYADCEHPWAGIRVHPKGLLAYRSRNGGDTVKESSIKEL